MAFTEFRIFRVCRICAGHRKFTRFIIIFNKRCKTFISIGYMIFTGFETVMRVKIYEK